MDQGRSTFGPNTKYQLQNAYQDYPIVSKAKPFKGFRKNLMQFWSRLIEKAQHDVVLDDRFLDQLLSWLVAMSSSLFRPFRHTATAISFAITGQLCAIAQQLAEEREIVSKQKQANTKKRGRGKSGESNDRAGELQSKTEKIETYLTEFFEG
jgi:cohesin complex subunit SA-1/2